MKQLFFSLSVLLTVTLPAQGQMTEWATAFRNNKALAGAHTGICIYDPMAGKYLYQYQDDKYFLPASNTKIFTTYTVLRLLGDSIPAFRYQLTADTLYVQGTADISFLHPAFPQQQAFAWLRAAKKPIALVPAINENLPMGPGWSWEDYETDYQPERHEWPMYGNMVTFYHRWMADSIAPAFFHQAPILSGVDNSLKEATPGRLPHSNQFYVHYPERNNNAVEVQVPFITGTVQDLALRLSDTLHRSITVTATRDMSVAAVYYSRPVEEVLRFMMAESDDGMAEHLLMAASSHLTDTISTAGVIAYMLGHQLKDLPRAPHWVDGSGLSRYNLFTPRDIVTVLQKLYADFGAQRVYKIFPTAGKGTLRAYYAGMENAIYAKTGSFGDCFNLSGYLVTKKGRRLVFSVMVNNHNDKNSNIRAAVQTFLRRVYEEE